MSKPLISIIVPIYNVEQYLEKCIDSLQSQSLNEIEIILVDDGSPDKCGEICERYAKNDCRIKVIHKPNGGLSDARNVGIKNASADFLMFIDSDDWIDSKTCETIYRASEDNNADVVVFGMKLVYDDGRIVQRHKGVVSKTPTHLECMRSLIYHIPDAGIFNNACNKMFRRELFDGITFPVGRCAEDQGTVYKVLHKAKRVYVVEELFYNYYQRNGSISYVDFSPKLACDRFFLGLERIDFFHDNYPELEDLEIARVMGETIVCIVKFKGNKDYLAIRNDMVLFRNKYKSKHSIISKYSRRYKMYYYCYPLFWFYARYILK